MGSASSVVRAQRSLRQAKASRQPICVHISDVAERHYSFRAATINGVRYGPSDLRAPRELYRFGWEHERLLWIGCIVSETFRVVGGGQKPCFAVMPCLLGMLTPELVSRIVGIAYERTHPECDPVLLRSLRGMPLEVVDNFLAGLTICHAVSNCPISATSAPATLNAEMLSRAMERVGYEARIGIDPSDPEEDRVFPGISRRENMLSMRCAGQWMRMEVLCVVNDASPLRVLPGDGRSQGLLSVAVLTPRGTVRVYTCGPLVFLLPRLAAAQPPAAAPHALAALAGPIGATGGGQAAGAAQTDFASVPGTGDSASRMLEQTLRTIREEFDPSLMTTTVYAAREMEHAQFDEWYGRYLDALNQLATQGGAPHIFSEVVAELERDLELLGACAVELPLREQAAAAIDLFRQKNIPVYLASSLPHQAPFPTTAPRHCRAAPSCELRRPLRARRRPRRS